MRKVGFYKKIGNIEYFVPSPLPPENPKLELDSETVALYGETMMALGKLNEMANRIPDIKRFIKAYVTKEALLSSSIEGIHTTLLDVFTQPLLFSIDKDTQLVLNYTKALDVALDMIKSKGFPLVERVILEAHKALMQCGAGDKADPGRYRSQSVKVGSLVPPPANVIPSLMADLEKYINIEDGLPDLIKAGLAHVQFETVHPFLDGNGRIGRLLIVLMLLDKYILAEPIIYPSYYFKKNHFEYYQRLNDVRVKGDFEGWIKFYLKIIKLSAIDAYKRVQEIEALFQNFTNVILNERKFSRTKESRLKALSVIFSYPVISIRLLSSELNVSYNTANQIISDFIEIGFLEKTSSIGSSKRDNFFKLTQYLDLLEKEYNL